MPFCMLNASEHQVVLAFESVMSETLSAFKLSFFSEASSE